MSVGCLVMPVGCQVREEMCTIHLGFQGGRMDPALQYYELLEREKTVNLWRRDRCDAQR